MKERRTNAAYFKARLSATGNLTRFESSAEFEHLNIVEAFAGWRV
jgi:hypothetical protein